MTKSLSYVPYLMGGLDPGARVDVMGGLDRGPRVDVMGGPDPARYPQAVREGAPRPVDFRLRPPKRGSVGRSAIPGAR